MYSNQYMIDNLNRQKDRIDDMIRNYQQPQPVNNFINTGLQNQFQNLYEVKKLNDNEDVENILIDKDSIFIGTNRMQIKKLDGTIEKYNITKTFPIDPKDKQIDELNKKVEDLERRLNNEHTEPIKSVNKINKPDENVDEFTKSKSNTTSK